MQMPIFHLFHWLPFGSDLASSPSEIRHSDTRRDPETGVPYLPLPCWLFPAVRLACVFPVLHVRRKFPLRAAYSRQVLPPVRGFPTL